jgi:uncharacterized repeat protein (TIGR02543 family)
MRTKRLLSLVMALSMLFSLFAPSIVWAAEEGGHDVPLVESGGKNPAKVKTYKVSIRVSPSKAKAKVYVYDRRDDGNYADAQGTKYKSGLKLPAGDYHYIATAKGYLPAEGDFAVVDKNVRIKVRLEKEGQTPPLRISEEEPISNRDENELADGWYLAGTFNTWAPTADYQLIPNLDNVCSLTLTLTAEDEFKAVYVENGALKTESYYAGDDGPFSDDTNRNLRPGEAGEYTVYFRDVINGDSSTKFLRATTLTDGKYYYIGSDIDWKKTGAIELQSVRDGSYSLYRAFDTDTEFKVLQCSEYGKLSWYGDSNGNNIYVGAGQYKILFDGAAVTVEQTYTITWKDEDGTELKKDHLVSGETPRYTDDPPTKASDAEHVYTFSGWTPEVVPVTGDATYKAVYSSVPTTVRLGSDRYFANVEDAVVTAPDGSTITLLASQTTYGFEVGALDGSSRSITLDLDKYDLTLQGNFGIVVEEGNALTITGTTGTLRNGAGAVTVRGTCTITGGRFDFDPSTWVPTGYQVTKDTETYLWTVTRVTTCTLQIDYNVEQGTVTGAGEYPWGTEVTITATPAEGYVFAKWTGDINGTDPSYTFTITEDTYIEAIFLEYHSLTATCSPAEGGAVVGTGTYAGSKEATLRAVPAPGYRFTAWREGDEKIVSYDATYTFTMPDEDYSLTAVFEVDPDNQITEWNAVTVVVQGDPSKVSYSLWTGQVGLRAAPRFENDRNAWAVPLTKGRGKVPVGWHLGVDLEAQGSYSSSIAWTDEGDSEALTGIDSSGLSSFDTSGFLGNGPVTMELILDPVYLTLQPNGPEVNAESQAVATNWRTPIMANPFTWEGHTFTGWNTVQNPTTENPGTPYADGEEITLTEPLTLYAQWELNSCEITATCYPVEGGSVTGAGTYECGESVTLTAAAEEGYRFVNWMEDGEEVSTDNPYTFTVTGPRDLMANFKLVHTVTFDPDGGIFPGETTSVSKMVAVLKGDCVTAPAAPIITSYGSNSKPGTFTFMGWYLEDATEPFNFANPIEGNITLKARYWAYYIFWGTSATEGWTFDESIPLSLNTKAVDDSGHTITEYMASVSFTATNHLKVARAATFATHGTSHVMYWQDTTTEEWYDGPNGNNYIVDKDHESDATFYFRPQGNNTSTAWFWQPFGGKFYIARNHPITVVDGEGSVIAVVDAEGHGIDTAAVVIRQNDAQGALINADGAPVLMTVYVADNPNDCKTAAITGAYQTHNPNVSVTINADGTFSMPDAYVTIQVDLADNHSWPEEPNWTWTGNDGDGYTATATFTCTKDSAHTKTVDATVTGPVIVNGTTTYTATVTAQNSPDGKAHYDTKTITKLDVQYNLRLQDEISIGFLIGTALPEGTTADEYTVVVTDNTSKADLINKTLDQFPKTEDGAYYTFPAKAFAAKEMTHTIHLKLSRNDAVLKEADCSIQSYCNTVLEGEYDETLQALCQYVLEYGAESQKYFTYEQDNLANAAHNSTSGMEDIPSSLMPVATQTTCTGLTETIVNLNLVSKTVLNFRFVAADGYTKDSFEYSVKKGDAAYTNVRIATEGSYIVLSICGIAAKELGDEFTVTIKNKTDGTSRTFTGSAMAYVNLSQDQDAIPAALAKALYNYYLVAYTYFH